MNLFTGSSAKFRMDDPAQKNDKIPLSMQGERRRKIDENMFEQLMSDFFCSLDENAGCYESKISDWFVGISGTREAGRTKRRYHVVKTRLSREIRSVFFSKNG